MERGGLECGTWYVVCTCLCIYHISLLLALPFLNPYLSVAEVAKAVVSVRRPLNVRYPYSNKFS